MIQKTPLPLTMLYAADETAWLEAMSELIQAGRHDELDFEHLAEYLADMARRDRREVQSRLTVLWAHVLKWQFQPERRSRSWRQTIVTQRQELTQLLASGVLRNHAEEVLADAFKDGVDRARADTGLGSEAFPAECPYTLDELLAFDVLDEDK